MRKIFFIIILLILIAAGFYFYYKYFQPSSLSANQEEIIKSFGSPRYFSISYLPQGEGENLSLVRKETWAYPDHQKQITFLAGEILSLDDINIKNENKVAYSALKPEDFDFSMDYQEVVAKLGEAKVEKVDLVPELFTQGEIETYFSDQVIFTIEQGYLTYLETVGIEFKEEG